MLRVGKGELGLVLEGGWGWGRIFQGLGLDVYGGWKGKVGIQIRGEGQWREV